MDSRPKQCVVDLMSKELSGVPIPNAEYRVESIDGETLLYHTGDTRTVYLNDTASLIWNLCDGERSVDDIVNLLVDSYPDAASDIRDDVNTALGSFMENGAMTLG